MACYGALWGAGWVTEKLGSEYKGTTNNYCGFVMICLEINRGHEMSTIGESNLG